MESSSLSLGTGFDHMDPKSPAISSSLPPQFNFLLPLLPNTHENLENEVSPLDANSSHEPQIHHRLSTSAILPQISHNSRSLSKKANPFKKMKKWITSDNSQDDYKIEYSVLKPSSQFPPLTEEEYNDMFSELSQSSKLYFTLNDFNKLINNVIECINVNVPKRISKGSSGSYFIYSRQNEPVGVFKPRDEEPYGPLSPKWGKWIHRTFFPWFFGRSCLLNNQGYISEAGASYIDQRLLGFIVPYTDVIYLNSPSFYHSLFDRNIKPKIGSFQFFLKGYEEASDWFTEFPLPNQFRNLPDYSDIPKGQPQHFYWSKHSLVSLQLQLEKLVILDYLIRNTDRSLDNWMINVEWEDMVSFYRPNVKIGAIDSGLAFPWKHPDEWRSFPYGWLFLPYTIIGQPFSDSTRKHYLSVLTSTTWWESTIMGLKKISQKDRRFKNRYFLQQISILKGQAFNIIEILKTKNSTPLDLAKRQRIRVEDEIMTVPKTIDDNLINAMNSSINEDEITPLIDKRMTKVVIERIVVEDKSPFFTCC